MRQLRTTAPGGLRHNLLKPGLAAITMALLAACATPYRPPSTPPPPAWDGAFGYEPIGEATIREGVLRTGDAIVSQPVKYIRTGLVAETVRTKGAFGGDLIVPKGTKAYAANYSLLNRYVTKPMQGIENRIDPIEWCVILAAGKDGKQKEPETVCLFYETPERARYMETYNPGGFPFQPAFGDASGVDGPLPVIDEQPVDFGPLASELQVLEMEGGQLKLADVLTDGDGRRVFRRETYRMSSGARLSLKLAGREVVITPAGADAVEVKVAP